MNDASSQLSAAVPIQPGTCFRNSAWRKTKTHDPAFTCALYTASLAGSARQLGRCLCFFSFGSALSTSCCFVLSKLYSFKEDFLADLEEEKDEVGIDQRGEDQRGPELKPPRVQVKGVSQELTRRRGATFPAFPWRGQWHF